ncbi:MAG: gamma-glutamyltransferase [Bacteroidetes bacterium]|nr:gamma-glutamyltransferase [Bacteroidota bacterium]
MLTRIFSNFLLFVLLSACTSSVIHKTPPELQLNRAKNAMVVSESSYASEAGIQILKNGGNAVDAAVAVGFALAVTYPEAGNIGGGGFMVIHIAGGKNTTIDFRETAPQNSNRNMFLNNESNFDLSLSTEGWTSSGIPGTVAGLIYALEQYGSLSLDQVIQPAIDLAENGFIVEYKIADRMANYTERFNKYSTTKKIFTDNGNPIKEGTLLKQNDLAKTLRLIKEFGKDGFYKGETAKLIVEQSDKNGGYITYDDLSNYTPLEKPPITGSYKGIEIISMPPSSSGGIAFVQSLNILENFIFKQDEWNASRYVHTLSETFKHVYADRSKHLGDSKYYDVPVEHLISKNYASKIAGSIKDSATSSIKILPSDISGTESDATTHYNVIDSKGDAVSVTYTINGLFGNKIVVDGAGFFMNNEMDDFSSQPGIPNQFGLIGGEANSIEPDKRMLSSMTPVIALKNDKPFLLLGGRGGSKIITAVLQTFLNVVDFRMELERAIQVPRFHHQWLPDVINFEHYAFTSDVKENLASKGHKLIETGNLAKVLGIMIDDNGTIWGSFDPRGEGLAIGY